MNTLTELPAHPAISTPQQLDQAAIEEAPSVAHALAPVPFALDDAEPMNPMGFPNAPRMAGHAPASTIPNVQHLLGSYGITARYNVIKKKLLVTMPGHSGSPDNFDNVAITQILSLAALNGMKPGPIPSIVEAIGDRQQFNPVADWIQSAAWDGVDRLPAICATLVEREGFPTDLKNVLIERWLLGAVAAALMPTGFRGRGVLTLQGPQGIGKTAWTKALVPDAALAQAVIKLDHHLDAGNKDSLLSAVTHWIVEIGELDGSLKKDIARLKGFLTADQDKVRRPYARVDSEYSRKTVFCATVNEDEFLVDTTGNTRFWTLPVTKIEYVHGIDMQQLFAQLATKYEDGAQWWLTQDEERRLEEQNKQHRTVSAIRELLLDRLDLDAIGSAGLERKTSIQVLKAIGIERPTNPQCRECGAVLRELLGDPTMRHSQGWWSVPFKDVDTTAFDPYGELNARKAVLARDLDDW